MTKHPLAVALGLAGALGFVANAAFAAPYLGGTVQKLEDDDAEVLLDNDGIVRSIDASTVIQVGDLFAGVIKIQKTEDRPKTVEIDLQTAPDTFTGIFLIETATVLQGTAGLGDAAADFVDFAPATQTQWDSVFGAGGLLDISSVFDIADLDGAGPGTDGIASGTMVLVFDGVPFSQADEISPISLSDSATSFVDGGTLQYEFGFNGVPGEFWKTTGPDAAFPVAATDAKNRLALNVTRQWAGPDLNPFNFLGATAAGAIHWTHDTQLQGEGGFESEIAGNWGLKTDTDLYISPVPEPGTLALLGLGLAGFGVATKRNKKS